MPASKAGVRATWQEPGTACVKCFTIQTGDWRGVPARDGGAAASMHARCE